MNDPAGPIRWQLLSILGAVSVIRQISEALPTDDAAYFDRELTVLQSAVHRMFQFLDDSSETAS